MYNLAREKEKALELYLYLAWLLVSNVLAHYDRGHPGTQADSEIYDS